MLDEDADPAGRAAYKASRMSDQEEEKILSDARKLPLSERVAHKSWKARSEAYDSVAAACERALSEEDECFAEYGADRASVRLCIDPSFADLCHLVNIV